MHIKDLPLNEKKWYWVEIHETGNWVPCWICSWWEDDYGGRLAYDCLPGGIGDSYELEDIISIGPEITPPTFS